MGNNFKFEKIITLHASAKYLNDLHGLRDELQRFFDNDFKEL